MDPLYLICQPQQQVLAQIGQRICQPNLALYNPVFMSFSAIKKTQHFQRFHKEFFSFKSQIISPYTQAPSYVLLVMEFPMFLKYSLLIQVVHRKSQVKRTTYPDGCMLYNFAGVTKITSMISLVWFFKFKRDSNFGKSVHTYYWETFTLMPSLQNGGSFCAQILISGDMITQSVNITLEEGAFQVVFLWKKPTSSI